MARHLFGVSVSVMNTTQRRRVESLNNGKVTQLTSLFRRRYIRFTFSAGWIIMCYFAAQTLRQVHNNPVWFLLFCNLFEACANLTASFSDECQSNPERSSPIAAASVPPCRLPCLTCTKGCESTVQTHPRFTYYSFQQRY